MLSVANGLTLNLCKTYVYNDVLHAGSASGVTTGSHRYIQAQTVFGSDKQQGCRESLKELLWSFDPKVRMDVTNGCGDWIGRV